MEVASEKISGLRAFLRQHVLKESESFFGVGEADWVDHVVSAWLNDQENSAWRFEAMKEFAGQSPSRSFRILDMAAGCGTFVYYGLLHGYDVWGVEPEDWKHDFCRRKAEIYDYPESFTARFVKAVGESLPFPDDSFDCVSSYQTLEHVQDPSRCLEEMCRVTRPGGWLQIQCPDYRSTFEPHYRLPWLPLFPRAVASAYLAAIGRPVKGLHTIQYTTTPRLLGWLRQATMRNDRWRLEVLDRRSMRKGEISRRSSLPRRFRAKLLREHWTKLFRQEINVDLLVRVLEK